MSKMNDIILYPEDGWTPYEMLDRLIGRKTVKEYAFILHDQDLNEDGSLKKPHYHLFLNYGSSNPKPKDVASWFGINENAVEKVHSNKWKTLRYYLHLDDPSKHQYRLEDMCASFDVEKFFLNESIKLCKSDLIKQCADGTINKRNFKDYIDAETFVKHQNAIESAWDYFNLCKEQEIGTNRACEVIWIYGETEVGKTTFATMFAQEQGLSFCITAGGKDPFSNYKGEDVLIIDDPRPDNTFPYNELLKILDPNFLTPVYSRYKNKIIYAKYIFITNPYSPEEFYRQLPNITSKDKPGQLYRRISQVWEFTKDQIYIYSYDTPSKHFVPDSVCPNPVIERLSSKEAIMPKPALSILDSMLHESPKQIKRNPELPLQGFTLVDDDEIDF